MEALGARSRLQAQLVPAFNGFIGNSVDAIFNLFLRSCGQECAGVNSFTLTPRELFSPSRPKYESVPTLVGSSL